MYSNLHVRQSDDLIYYAKCGERLHLRNRKTDVGFNDRVTDVQILRE